MDPDKIVSDFCAAWSRGNLDELVEAFAEDAVYHNIPMAPLVGKDAIRTFLGGLVGGIVFFLAPNSLDIVVELQGPLGPIPPWTVRAPADGSYLNLIQVKIN